MNSPTHHVKRPTECSQKEHCFVQHNAQRLINTEDGHGPASYDRLQGLQWAANEIQYIIQGPCGHALYVQAAGEKYLENSQKCSASNAVYAGRGTQKAEFASTTVITCFQKLVMLNSTEAVQMPKNLLLQGSEK